MVAFYKHDIPAWMDGTESLSDGAYRVYHVVCQLIYLNEGPIALNEHGLAGRCRQSIRSFRAHLKELIDGGKLASLDGRLENFRAEKELEKIFENRVNASEGGKKSGEVRSSQSKPLKNNDLDEATLHDNRSLKEKSRVEESREESSAQTARPKAPRSKPKTPLPDDWQPTGDDIQYGERLGLTRPEIVREAERFRNHARSIDRRCTKWGQAFHNWLIKAAEFLNRKPRVAAAEAVDWDGAVVEYQRTEGRVWAFRKLGPEPGYGGCKVPREILEKYGYASREPSAA